MKTKNYYLYFSAITATSLSMPAGLMLVWNSPIIPKLLSNDTSINPLGAPITVLQESLLTSLNPIGTILCVFFVGKLPDIIGRKKTMILLAIGAIVALIGLYLTKYFYQFILFGLIMSTNLSAVNIAVFIYVAEIAENCNRGSLGCMVSIWIVLGQLYGYVLGAFTTANGFFLFSAIPLFIFLGFSIFIPESPIYLSMKGDKIGALTVLKKVRRPKSLREIEEEHAERELVIHDNKSSGNISLRNVLKCRSVKKALILSIGTRCISDLSGFTMVLSFMSTLLDDSGISLNGDVMSIIIISIKMTTSILTVVIIEKAGRRILILLGSILCGTSMFTLGLYFYFKHNQYPLTRTIKFIPIISVVFFVCAFTVGLGGVPFLLRAELLPNELRSIGSSLAQFIGAGALLIVSFSYPLVSSYLGVHYNMFAFSLVCFSGFIFLYFLLPETKGKSFNEIKILLNN